MRPAADACSQSVNPRQRSSQTAGAICTTAGGVPRLWRSPSSACTAPNGGILTSTAWPGARSLSTCNRYRTAVATSLRAAVSPVVRTVRTLSTACMPSGAGIRRGTRPLSDNGTRRNDAMGCRARAARTRRSPAWFSEQVWTSRGAHFVASKRYGVAKRSRLCHQGADSWFRIAV